MKTEYELYHWPTDETGSATNVGRYDTIDEAMSTAGHPSRGDWGESAGGGWILAPGIVASLDRTQSPWLIAEVDTPETDPERIDVAIRLAVDYGQIDGSHHKTWLIDQMLRALAGDRYEQVIADYRDGEDGPDTYSWDEGIAP